MTINIPLLTDVMVHIRRHPESWDQDNWGRAPKGCGTTHCIAGWTAQLSGEQILWAPCPAGLYALDVRLPHGEVRTIGRYAMEKLGLTRDQAQALFHSTNVGAWSTLEVITKGEITLWKIDEIIAEQDAARHRKDDPVKTDDEQSEDKDLARELVAV